MNRDKISADVVQMSHSADEAELPKLRQFFEVVLNDDPDHLDALYGYGVIAFRQGDADEAVRCLRRAADRAPDHMGVQHNLMRACLLAFRFEDALGIAKGLIGDHPDDPELYGVVHFACQRLNRREELRRVLATMETHCRRGYHAQPLSNVALKDVDPDLFAALGSRASTEAQPAEDAVRTWRPLRVTEAETVLVGAARLTQEPEGALFSVVAKAGGNRSRDHEAAADGPLAAGGVSVWRAVVSGLIPGATYRARLAVRTGSRALHGEWQDFAVPIGTAPEAVTDAATPVGLGGATLNGAVGGTSLQTRFHFRYGTSADALERSTPDRQVPPGRYGRVADTGANACHRISVASFDNGFRGLAGESGVPPPGPPTDAAMVLSTPFGKDRHHLGGIGVVDLMAGWVSPVQVRDRFGGADDAAVYPLLEYPGEKLDLREAQVSVVLRGRDFDPKEFSLVAWFHANTGTALLPTRMEDAAPWALTAGMGSDRIASDGRWQVLTFRFRDNTNDWSFGGNNVEEMGWEAERYRYLPLRESLSRNRGNICFCFVGGSDLDTPEGEIDVASLELRYRSWSLLGPGFGAEIVRWPADTVSDPACLAGGRIADPEHMWRSAPLPGRPAEFVWRLGGEANLRSLRVFQDLRWPSKEIEISVSQDDEEFEPVWSATLRPDDAGTTDLPDRAARNEPRNLASIHVLDAPARCRFVRLRILSGYESDFWGLDAIEAFGDGIEPTPEVEPCAFSEELSGLAPGTTVFYRLVAENPAGRSDGEVMRFTVPEDGRPIVHWARVTARTPDRATILVRVTPMGAPTRLIGRVEGANGDTLFEASAAAGCAETPRHMTFVVPDLDDHGAYRAVLTAENAQGRSAALEVAIPPEGGDGNPQMDRSAR